MCLCRKLPHGVGYPFLLLHGDFRKERQGKRPFLVAMSHREISGPVPEAGVGRQKRQGLPVTHHRFDSPRLQESLEVFPFFRQNRIKVIDMPPIRRTVRNPDPGNSLQELVVAAGRFDPLAGPGFEMRKFDPQHRGLQPIQPAVDSLDQMIPLAPMPGVQRHPLGQLVVLGHDRPGIPHRSKVFARVKRKGGDFSKRSDFAAFELGEMGLGAVLDDPKPVLFRQRLKFGHGGRQAVKVNHHDSLRPGRDLPRNFGRIQNKLPFQGVGKDHGAACLGDRFRRRNPRVGGHDHLIPRLDSQRPQGDVKGIRAVGAGDAVSNPESPGELILKQVNLLPPDKGRFLDDPLHRGIQFRTQGRMLGGQVGERHAGDGGRYFDFRIFLAGLPA